MRINNEAVFGWENAIKGMRYSFDSEDQSDTLRHFDGTLELGEKDLHLMTRLIRGGSEHRKFLRAVHAQFSAKMSMTFWKQYDTYKIATTTLSRSTMHTITKRELTNDDFAPSEFTPALEDLIKYINTLIVGYNNLKSYPNTDPEDLKRLFNQIIDLLPGCYLQERMLDLNYETALNIIRQRMFHKLSNEWGLFVDTLLNLPYMKEFYENGVKGKNEN